MPPLVFSMAWRWSRCIEKRKGVEENKQTHLVSIFNKPPGLPLTELIKVSSGMITGGDLFFCFSFFPMPSRRAAIKWSPVATKTNRIRKAISSHMTKGTKREGCLNTTTIEQGAGELMYCQNDTFSNALGADAAAQWKGIYKSLSQVLTISCHLLGNSVVNILYYCCTEWTIFVPTLCFD